ncbi:CoA ester lyase [Arthrobacter sp. ISL-5]|uniref:HpcH/HpaI aldolase/citrate lyase family protein n=1 Tax=Arthrobacter sp. ISL-5 TaxID=2819111 RepID=UPI001BE8C1ED|nr:CoA ester lyase [Arthrobacter sp. ISL-5]MBT2556020.1 CoA ester lyase [Arthrobacter sp. ISL-5]
MGPAILFCPANRPDRYAKAMDSADAIILDLEDAVAPLERQSARQSLVDNPVDPNRTIVRVNPVDTDDFELDLRALRQTGYRYIMLAKTETADSLAKLAGYSVIALCETAKGILNAPSIAEEGNVVALMWGAEDLVASLGGVTSRLANGHYRDIALHSRSQVLLAAGSAGKPAIDSVYTNITDLAGLKMESDDAQASGFAAKASIHPAQMPIIRSSFLPAQSEVIQARRILAAAEKSGGGVFAFEGRMVDEPILRHARKVLARAERSGTCPEADSDVSTAEALSGR